MQNYDKVDENEKKLYKFRIFLTTATFNNLKKVTYFF